MKTRTNEEKERTMLERGTFLQILFNPTKNQFKTTNDYEHYLVKNVNKLYSTQSYCPDSNDVSENNLQSPERAFNSYNTFANITHQRTIKRTLYINKISIYNMAWHSSGSTNDELVDNLVGA